MDEATRSILLNKEVIAVDQDPLGQQGQRVWKQGESEVWVKPLTGGPKAVLLFNRSEAPATIRATAELVGAPARARVRDLWAHKNVGRWTGSIQATVEPHGVAMFRIGP
jgi:alpha-galactosidase